MDKRAVYITGLGALTASGHSIDATWDALLAEKTNIDTIQKENLIGWPCQLGGEIKDFDSRRALSDRKLLKLLSPQDVFGLYVVEQALNHSAILHYRDSLSPEEKTQFNEQSGVYVGSPGNKYFQQYDFLDLVQKSKGDLCAFAQDLFQAVHPTWLLRILPNNVLAYTGICYGFKGPNHNVTNHAASGMQALMEAYHAIRSGRIARAVVVAYDLGLEPQALFYYQALNLLSSRHLKPFDKDHDGTILAEGAVALILESEESLAARENAIPYAQILGLSSQSEAAGVFGIEKEGSQLAGQLSRLCDSIQVEPESLGMVVAHGNGSPLSDQSEAAALTAFAENNPSFPLTAFKWSMGHSLAASGLLDTALSAYALYQQQVPGLGGFSLPAAGCEHLNLSATQRSLEKPFAMVINRGFGSVNTALVMKACVN